MSAADARQAAAEVSWITVARCGAAPVEADDAAGATASTEVAKTATEKEIKGAYRKLARKFHPDVNPGDKVAESKFKEINEAYEVLGDPEKRKKYDELGANWRMYEQAGAQGGANPFAGGWNVNMGGGGGQGGFRTMTQEEMESMFGDENPFSDFFTTFFGGGGFGREAGSR